MKKLMASSKKDTDVEMSDADDSKPQWTKGVPMAQQMYIVQEYHSIHGYDSDEHVTEIEADELRDLKKKAQKATKNMY